MDSDGFVFVCFEFPACDRYGKLFNFSLNMKNWWHSFGEWRDTLFLYTYRVCVYQRCGSIAFDTYCYTGFGAHSQANEKHLFKYSNVNLVLFAESDKNSSNHSTKKTSRTADEEMSARISLPFRMGPYRDCVRAEKWRQLEAILKSLQIMFDLFEFRLIAFGSIHSKTTNRWAKWKPAM